MKCCEDNSEQFGLANYVTVTYLWNDRSVNPSTRRNLAHILFEVEWYETREITGV